MVDNFFSNACKELHLDVMKSDGSKSRGVEMEDPYGISSVWAVYEVWM